MSFSRRADETLNRELISELRRNLKGPVFDSETDLRRYSVDESIFSIRPQVVVAPVDETDLQELVAIAQFHSTPITARGGGSGIAGQAIGNGIVVDFSQGFRDVLEIGEDYAVVQPGVVLNDLNLLLAKRGRRFSPDPGSRNVCTIGGMVATNASGPRSLKHGDTRDHVRRLRVVLADGAIMESSALARRFPNLHQAIAKEKDLIRQLRPRVRKNSSGFALEELCSDPPSYSRFLVGTEGTLALTSEIEIKIIPLAGHTSLAIFPFGSIDEAVRVAEEIVHFEPAAVELIDTHIIQALKKANPMFISAIGLDNAEASLWVEWEEPLPRTLLGQNCYVIEDSEGQSNLWALRSKASRLLHEQSRDRKPLRCIEDGVVPMEKLGVYVSEVREILKRHDADGALFGHIGQGHLHINPQIDVTKPDLSRRIERLMNDVHQLIWSLGGSVSGEHGDGVLRKRSLEKQWGKLVPLFQFVKETFDPVGIFNPDKKLPTSEYEFWPSFRNFSEIGMPPTRPTLPTDAAWPTKRTTSSTH